MMVPLDRAPVHGACPTMPRWGLITRVGALFLAACLAVLARGARGQDGPQEVRFYQGVPPKATHGYLSHDSRLLAIPGQRDRIDVWHIATGRRDELHTAPARPKGGITGHPLPVAVFASDSRHLAALYDESGPNPARISWWDLDTRTEKVVANLPLQTDAQGLPLVVIRIGVSRDDSLLSALVSAKVRPRDGSDNYWVNTLHRWRLPGGEQVFEKQLNCRDDIEAFSPDGRFALVRVGKWNPFAFKAMLLDLDGEKVLWTKTVGAQLAFTADGRSVLSVDDRRVLLLDVETGSERCLLELTREQADGGGVFLSISPDRRLLAFCKYWSPVVIVYATATGREIARFRFAPDDLYASSIGFSPDGRYILTTTGYVGPDDEGRTPELRLWRVPEKWRHLEQ